MTGFVDHHDGPLLVICAEIDGNLPRHLLGCIPRDFLVRTLESDRIFKTKAIFNIEMKYRHPSPLGRTISRGVFLFPPHSANSPQLIGRPEGW